MVESYYLDDGRRRDQLHSRRIRALFPGPLPGSLPGFAFEIFLPSLCTVLVKGIALFAIGGLPFVLWGIFFRVTVGLHATWMVNSLTHFWGKRRFATSDSSRNNLLVALLTFGEGWHNNHHACPTPARPGLAWHEIDLSWMGIRFLKMVGLQRQIRPHRHGVHAKFLSGGDRSETREKVLARASADSSV